MLVIAQAAFEKEQVELCAQLRMNRDSEMLLHRAGATWRLAPSRAPFLKFELLHRRPTRKPPLSQRIRRVDAPKEPARRRDALQSYQVDAPSVVVGAPCPVFAHASLKLLLRYLRRRGGDVRNRREALRPACTDHRQAL